MNKKKSVEEIIKQNTDPRAGGMVVYLILDQGWSRIETMTDDDIENTTGNALMTTEFSKSLMRTARAIVQECELEDLLYYAATCMYFKNCTRQITLYQGNWKKDDWEHLCNEFQLHSSLEIIAGTMVLAEEVVTESNRLEEEEYEEESE